MSEGVPPLHNRDGPRWNDCSCLDRFERDQPTMPTEPGLHKWALEIPDELNVVEDDPLLIFPPESESAVKIAEPAEGVLIRLRRPLRVLADDVMRKADALESQTDVIERAGVDVRRVIQIVSTMETRLATLNDEDHLAGCAETMLAQLKQIAAETSKQFEQIENVKCGLESKLSDFEKEVQALSASARSHLEQCIAQKNALVTGSRAIGLGRRQPFAPLVRHRRTVLLALVAATLVGLVVELNHARPNSADATVVATRNPIPTASAMSVGDAPPRHEVSTVAPVASPVVPIVPPVLRSSRGPRPPTSPARRQEFIGTLTVESEPSGAAVFIDRQSVGQTPLSVAGRRAGSHVVWIERQGYRRWTAAVRVAADKVTRISASLEPDPNE